ncbi:MAG: translation initiation factor IF-2 subunit gamma [Ignisphaera sp.]|nr:translation initiation factor IF-2 subunit gamma [Ignisphaera sp.]MCX8167809.1 translation initiation factor IF-2 subunit gamma [Ignisphaera sp.]MDW8086077.1 translation initiation factor IF-2 subunit gamma [Ignisphaera sp.]
MSAIPTMSIGVVGHVDHGKTTLVQALTGVWTARYSEELKRSMTIKLGYAEGYIGLCEDLEVPESYTTGDVCPQGSKPRIIKSVSYVDAPGHEVLMATMLSGAALMDAAILVIAANEPCPQPQTREHLKSLEIIGLDQLIVVQNKIDIVSYEQAKDNYKQIVNFLNTTKYSKVPVIPVSALHRVNIDVLAMSMVKLFREPERDYSRPAIMLIARSFDVNLPGTRPEKLVGGVVGGSVLRGVLRVGEEVEIKPGIRVELKGGRVKYEPLVTQISSIRYGSNAVDEAKPGGLVAIGTTMDPSITKGDALMGNILGHSVPEPVSDVRVEYKLFERVLGSKDQEVIEPLKARETVFLIIKTAWTRGALTKVGRDEFEAKLERPVVTLGRDKVAIIRQVKGRWRLVGWGQVLE